MSNSNTMRGEGNGQETSPVLSLSTTTKKTLLFSFCFFFNIIFFFFNLKNFSSFILSLPFKLLSSPLPSLFSSLSFLQFSPSLHLSSQISPFLHFPLLPSRPRSPSSSPARRRAHVHYHGGAPRPTQWLRKWNMSLSSRQLSRGRASLRRGEALCGVEGAKEGKQPGKESEREGGPLGKRRRMQRKISGW